MCLFALSGYWGYLGLMQSVALAAPSATRLPATVLHSEVIAVPRQEGLLAGHGKSWWGREYAIELTVRVDDFDQVPAESEVSAGRLLAAAAVYRLMVRPPFPMRAMAMWQLRDYPPGEQIQVQVTTPPGADTAGGWTIVAPGKVGVLPPLLLALFAVLCLATSLRYQTAADWHANGPTRILAAVSSDPTRLGIPRSSNP